MNEQHSAPASKSLVTIVKVIAIALAFSAVACGGPPDRPEVQQVSGTSKQVVRVSAQQDSEPAPGAPCEHGTVSECKIWITEVDCYSGLKVCDHGEFSDCMDADAAEELLAQLSQPQG